jgi:hypothetical protein
MISTSEAATQMADSIIVCFCHSIACTIATLAYGVVR